MPKGTFTFTEIASQPQTWHSILDGEPSPEIRMPEDISSLHGNTFLVTGCGSTYYLSISVATLLRKLGIAAWAFPAAELAYFTNTVPPLKPILLAISRSGTTSETIWAVENFRKRWKEGKVFVVTTQAGSTLAQMADRALAASQAKEESVAQTRSFTSMFLLSQMLCGALAGDGQARTRLQALPPALEELLKQAGDLPQRIGEDASIKRFFFLGGGPLYGLACEAMLKTKEMACEWAEAYHPLEFRHGPMSVVNEESLVVCFVSDSEQEAEARVMHDMKRLGAKTMALVEDSTTVDWCEMDYVFRIKTGLDEWDRGAIYLPLIHWMAYYRSLSKGLDPDRPTNLSAVVELG